MKALLFRRLVWKERQHLLVSVTATSSGLAIKIRNYDTGGTKTHVKINNYDLWGLHLIAINLS